MRCGDKPPGVGAGESSHRRPGEAENSVGVGRQEIQSLHRILR